MDKSWMNKSRLSKDYELGVDKFIEYGFSNTTNTSIRCPCLKCGNCEKHSRNDIRDHLYVNGIDESYTIWFCHGEELPSSTIHREYYKSDNRMYEENDIGGVKEMIEVAQEEYSKDPNGFEKLLNDAEKPLYRGCKKFTKQSTLVKLYNLKVRFGWSDISFSELLKLFKEILPDTNELPSSMYEAKKTLGALGMDYEKIHACPNDCCLYRKEYVSANSCPECGESRWKSTGNKKRRQKEIPAKVLWYFPPIPRFKKMYRTLDCAKNLTWHSDDRVVDGKLRHPADSPAWKLVDFTWPDFGSEHRNLRLALSADGINPHGNMSSKYSCWPVVMIIYNLPPWLCMKRKFMMLSMLISGPKQPGDDIGIYLAPLVEDLKFLWESGVQCYDAYRDELFNLRAVLLWTINDFPAYGNLSGCSVKGYKACPICGDNTSSIRLKHGKKMAYLGHRIFLSCNHMFRRQKKSFNGQKELGTIPEPLSGEEVFVKAKDIKFQVGKKKRKRQLKKGSTKSCWNRLSAFFELPYWKHLHVRHCLDVMHIEKNVCMNRLGTLLDIPGKSKDGLSARLDLDDLKIRPELAPISGDKKIFIPPACYTLTREEKRCVLSTLSNVKLSTEPLEDIIKPPMKGKSCLLAKDVISNVVASGILLDDETLGSTIHGIPIGENNVRVSVDVAIVDVDLPIKVRDDLKTTKQSVGSHVPWPQHLVILNQEKKVKTKRNKNQVVDLPMQNLPIVVKSILRYAERVMTADASISMQLPEELFGTSHKSCVLRDDILDFCNMKEVKTLSLVAYMAYLHSYCAESDLTHKYIFVDPSLISVGHYTQEVRARNLSSRLTTATKDQLVIAPYNPGGHWSLLIVNPFEDIVYHLDSLRTSSRDDVKSITSTALAIFRAQKKIKVVRKNTLWKSVKCPLQLGIVECGYYVMRYMREIITKDSIIVMDVVDTRTSYTQTGIDEVRVEWAEFLGRYI